jgi:hypothetical protein
MDKSIYFEPDDYDDIYNKYFKDIKSFSKLDKDISYWYNTVSQIPDLLGLNKNIRLYKSDYGIGLKKDKDIILDGINNWENYCYNYNECTLCSSATIASLIVLSSLKRLGVKKILFETPTFFASIIQAKILGFDITLVPTYYENNYKFEINHAFLKSKASQAIWISQPRFGIGSNQCKKNINKILSQIKNTDYLIIDEANEQLYPSHLASYNTNANPNIIRFRSIFKPLGLNGPRISFILHNQKHRKLIESSMDSFQGGIDCFSVDLATKVFSSISKFKNLLDISHKQIINLKNKAETITNLTKIELSPLENGYIGSLIVHFDRSITHNKSRVHLLEFCKKHNMPVILGSSMYYAKENFIEHIRLSYFIREPLFINGIKLLSEYYD